MTLPLRQYRKISANLREICANLRQGSFVRILGNLNNAETRKSIEASGTVVAEPTTLAQLDGFYKKEAATGAAIAKSINLQAQ